jgi:hypothetical protein
LPSRYSKGLDALAKTKYVSLLHSVQTGSEVRTFFPPVALSPGVKWLGYEAEYLSASNVEVNNGGVVP